MENTGNLLPSGKPVAHKEGLLARLKIKKSLLSESILYTLASVGALAIDFGCYSALIRIFHLNYQVAAIIGFLLGLCFIYYMSVKFVFFHRSMENKWKEGVVFAITGLLGLALTSLILYLAVDILRLNYELAKLCSVSIVFIFNFSSRKILLFSEQRK